MKKILLLSLLLISNASQSKQLNSYQDAVEASLNGKQITYVVDWDNCIVNVPNITPNLLGRVTPEYVIIDKSGFMTSRGISYTHALKFFPNLGPVNQAYVYVFDKNNELHITTRFLDPVTYTERAPSVEVNCKLNTGFKVFA